MMALVVLLVILRLISSLRLVVLISLISILLHLISLENLKSSITGSAKLPIFDPSMISVKSSSFRAAMLSSLLIVALLFSSAPAYADFRPDVSFALVPNVSSGVLDLAAGSAIDGALNALGVQLALGAGSLLTSKDLIQSVIFGTPLGVTGYEYQGKFYDLADQSTIRIRDDVVTIDGVDYKDIWLPHDAAVKFRTNALDFITYYNIVSESSGTYASGVGLLDGLPMYDVNGVLRSPTFVIPYTSSSSSFPFNSFWSVLQSPVSPDSNLFQINYSSSRISSSQVSYSKFPVKAILVSESGTTRCYYYNVNNTLLGTASHADTSYTDEPFDFDWVSSTISADPLPVEDGLRFRIPSSYVSGLPSVISPDLSDYSVHLNAISNAIEQARLANVVESTAFEEYDAPAPPVPSHGNIAEEPYASLDGSLTGIQDSLDNIDTNIGTVDESLDDIKVYSRDSSESLQSIDSNLSQSVADTSGIKGFVQQYLPGVHSFLSNISSSVSNIAGSVSAADENFFGNVVNAITVPFTPIFNIFKAGMGIWRYVVAWVGNISGPFTWSLTALSGAGSIFLSPIYAAAAAAVVLAVYKKFGR